MAWCSVRTVALPGTLFVGTTDGVADVLQSVEESERALTVFKSPTRCEEERSDGFYGCWTYDPDVVEWICTHLADRYESSK